EDEAARGHQRAGEVRALEGYRPFRPAGDGIEGSEMAAAIGVVEDIDKGPLDAVVRLAGLEIGDLLRRQWLAVPPERGRVQVDQFADRTVRHRVPVLPPCEMRPDLHTLALQGGLRHLGPHWTASREIDALGPVDLDELVRGQQLAG